MFKITGVVIILTIFLLSLLPGSDLPNVPGNDKLQHAIAYFVCMLCWGQVYRRPVHRLRLAIGFIAMGVLIECLQYFTPTRSFEFLDMVANAAGVITAWLVVTVQLSIERRWFGVPPAAESCKQR